MKAKEQECWFCHQVIESECHEAKGICGSEWTTFELSMKDKYEQKSSLVITREVGV